MTWEEQFDKQFLEYDGVWIRNDNGNCSMVTATDIKQLISELLKKRDKKIEQLKTDFVKCGIDVIRLQKKLKERDNEWLSCRPIRAVEMTFSDDYQPDYHDGYAVGFNASMNLFEKKAKAKGLIK